MKQFTKTMFENIKESLENQKGSSTGNFKDIIKTEPGNSYIVRLIPNTTDPAKTFFHYFHHQWTSPTTGQSVRAMCPTTWGERCSICEERIKLYKTGSEENKNIAKALKRKENWLVNVYVIKDPKHAENNGTNKIFRYGKQIDKIVNDAISGEDSAEFGPAIFDFSDQGCNFRIKVEKNEGDYPTYVSSKFLSKSSVEGLNEQNIDDVYNKAFELDKFFEKKDAEEIKKLIEQHFPNGESADAKPSAKPAQTTSTPKLVASTPAKPQVTIEEEDEEELSVAAPTNSGDKSATDKKIDDLLATL